MYDSLILVHHWFRWFVFLSGIWILIIAVRGWLRNETWGAKYTGPLWAFRQTYNYQVAFGLTLYFFLSPITKGGFANPALILKDDLTRFWVTHHGPLMLMAYSSFQVGSKVIGKKNSARGKLKSLVITMLITMTLITFAIPWPILSYGRPLIRLVFWEY